MKRLLRPLTTAVLLLSTVSPALAATVNGIDCETTEVDSELLQCASHDLAQNQKRLDDLVQQSLAALPPGARPLFDQAQKAWVLYRDAACQWNSYEMQTGKTSDLIRSTCLADLTSARVEELEAGLAPAGDASGAAVPTPTAPSPNTAIAPPVPLKP